MHNIKFINMEFNNVTFHDIKLANVEFQNCTFTDSIFTHVTSRKTYFIRTTFVNSDLNDTDFYSFRFKDIRLVNSSLSDLKPGCEVDFGVLVSPRNLYLESFIGQIAVVPGVIITTILLDKFGRVKVQGMYLIIEAIE